MGKTEERIAEFIVSTRAEEIPAASYDAARRSCFDCVGVMLAGALMLATPLLGKPAAKAPDARRELQAIYNKINAAAARKDVDGVYAYDADDCTFVDRRGRVHDASDGRQELEEVMEVIDSLKVTSTIQGFVGTDTEATVTVKDHAVARLANATSGRAVRFTGDAVSRDYWAYTAQGWRRKHSRLLSGHNAMHKNF